MRTYSFVSPFRERHFYQTVVYERPTPTRTVCHAVRMSPSQRVGFNFISERQVLRHSSLVMCKYAPVVPVLDVRHCRLHKLLSAVHDLYKFSSIMKKRDCDDDDDDDERTKRLFRRSKKRIARFLRRLTRRFPSRLNCITNKLCRRYLTRTLQTHLPLFVLKLLKKSEFLGQLLTVFMDLKYRLPAGASLVAALERDGSARFHNGVRILVMSSRNSHCDWDFPAADIYLRELSTLKPEHC